MAQASKGSAPFFLAESKTNVKSDGQECPSYTNKARAGSVLQNEVKHEENRNEEQHRQGQDERPIGDWR
jgi:hypothetical protein